MIRIRNRKGDITSQNEDDSFIELCNSDGEIVKVFYENTDNGEIYELDAGAKEDSKHYSKLFDVKFINKKIILNNR